MKSYRRWKPHETAFLRAMGADATAAEFGFTVQRCESRAYYLGLQPRKCRIRDARQREQLELAVRLGHAGSLTCREIARRTGAHPSTVMRMARSLGLIFVRPRDCMNCGGQADQPQP